MPTNNKKNSSSSQLKDVLLYIHNHIQQLNSSKVFAGVMIITLNIASKFLTIKLSKTMESYLKHTFSRDALIFAIAWVGSRDIYVAILITIIFIICMDYLFHEGSVFCILPEGFKNYHLSLLEENGETVTEDEIKHAEEVLEKAKKQKTELQNSNYMNMKYT
jgi:hypothetical protein